MWISYSANFAICNMSTNIKFLYVDWRSWIIWRYLLYTVELFTTSLPYQTGYSAGCVNWRIYRNYLWHGTNFLRGICQCVSSVYMYNDLYVSSFNLTYWWRYSHNNHLSSVTCQMYCLMPGSNACVGMMYFAPLFVLYINQSRAGCVSPHLHCATFFVVCIK